MGELISYGVLFGSPPDILSVRDGDEVSERNHEDADLADANLNAGVDAPAVSPQRCVWSHFEPTWLSRYVVVDRTTV